MDYKVYGIKLVFLIRFLYTERMKIKVGMTVETMEGNFVIRHINRSMTPALVMMTEKYKPKFGKKIYIRESALEYNLGYSCD